MSDIVPAPGPGTSPDASGACEDSPVQYATFAAFPISDPLRAAIAALGYEKPTPVQAATIEAALAGHDMLVQSKTGSGKTAAFGIPLLERLAAGVASPGMPRALVLLPTRELAHQVAAELRNLAIHKETRVLAIYGGVPMGRQIAALKAGVEVVIATPGRLLDHIRRGNMQLTELQAVVLDEADEMLSMGFWDDVTELLKLTPKSRQTMLFSATLPYEVAKAAAQFLREPTKVDLSGTDLTVAGIENCIIHVVPDLPKPRQMLYALEYAQPTGAIIFCNTRSETDVLAKYLTQSGLVAEPLSGNLKQKERDQVMGRIRRGELRYMVATDIAARGIDINDLSHVFNYSMPEFTEVYVHRVGRTGRAGKVGMAISLVDGRGLGTLTQLEKSFGITFTEVVLPPEDQVLRARSLRMIKELADKASMAEVSNHLPVAQDIVGGEQGAQIVAFLLKSYFNAAAEARRQPTAEDLARAINDGADGSDDAPAPRPPRAARSPEASEASSSEESGDRPRRRRRRGRGRSTEEGAAPAPARAAGAADDGHPPAAGAARSASGRTERSRGGQGRRPVQHATYEGLDVVSAASLLGGAPDPEPEPAPAAAPPRRAPARAANPSPATERDNIGNRAPPAPRAPSSRNAPLPEVPAGMARIEVNIGFDDGFKGRGAVAKKIAALAGLNEGIIGEVEARRDFAILKATPEIAELVLERVDGASLGKKVISVSVSS
jgi:ATP-dependent RNA helicase DeaD